MFASTNTFRPSTDFPAFAFASLGRHAVFAGVEGLEDAMMEQIGCELFGNFADDEPDFADHKHGRRAAYHCCGGRFGGDIGNKKRRRYERFDSDIEHAQRVQHERKATSQAIADGVAEYYSGEFRYYDLPRGHNKRRGKRGGTGGGGASHRLDGYDPRHGDDCTRVVEQSRTGHLVTVVVLPKKNCTRAERKAALSGVRTLPQFDAVRARLGLNS